MVLWIAGAGRQGRVRVKEENVSLLIPRREE